MKMSRVEFGKIDFLVVALDLVGEGSLQRAARKLGESRQELERWLDEGLGTVSFSQVVKLARISRIPMSLLCTRMGPTPDMTPLKQ